MTPTELKDARRKLGLSAAKLAEALKLGVHGGRTVRRWEAGACPIPGPVEVALGFMELERLERALGEFKSLRLAMARARPAGEG